MLECVAVGEAETTGMEGEEPDAEKGWAEVRNIEEQRVAYLGSFFCSGESKCISRYTANGRHPKSNCEA